LGKLVVHSSPCDAPGRPRRVGIVNTGNSCFLNSAMQLLLGIPELCLALFDERNVGRAGLSPVAALSFFADAYHAADGVVKAADALRLRQVLHELRIVKGLSGQEDPGEALALLFGKYDFPPMSDFESVVSSHITFHLSDATEDSSGKTDTIAANCEAEECRTTGQVEVSAMVPLHLPFIPQQFVSLDDLHDINFDKERLTDFESPLLVHTPTGSRLQVPQYVRVRKLEVETQLLLTIQLEEYDAAKDRVVKRADHIIVPEHWRGMTLVGAVQHMGEDNHGHYVAYKRRCFKSNGVDSHPGLSGGSAGFEWIKYNDDHTELVNLHTVVGASAEGKLLVYSQEPNFPSCGSLQTM